MFGDFFIVNGVVLEFLGIVGLEVIWCNGVDLDVVVGLFIGQCFGNISYIMFVGCIGGYGDFF